MKKIIFELVLNLCISSSFSHHIEVFNMTKENTDTVIITLDSTYTKDIIFKRAKEWILYNYNTPSKVIKAEINNEYIRINGINKSVAKVNVLAYIDLDYIMTIDVKDGKYRLIVSINEILCNMKDCGYGFYYGSMFKKDGSIKGYYTNWVSGINTNLNATNLSLYKYIISESKSNKNEW